jgi:hypothetical protein
MRRRRKVYSGGWGGGGVAKAVNDSYAELDRGRTEDDEVYSNRPERRWLSLDATGMAQRKTRGGGY